MTLVGMGLRASSVLFYEDYCVLEKAGQSCFPCAYVSRTDS